MPSIRKRIGYLPSIIAQETIIRIATKENLSQSKVVGILVEEALIARGGFERSNSNNLIRENLYRNENIMINSSFNYNELDEMVSDNGITYNTKKNNPTKKDNYSEPREKYNEELFEQFKQFILFQKMLEDN